METALQTGKQRLISFFPEVQVMVVPGDTIRFVDPRLDSFRNINTPADYYELRDGERFGCTTYQDGRKPASSGQ
jgi:molybdopterin-guanine dinucleotide biosynthesis protein A